MDRGDEWTEVISDEWTEVAKSDEWIGELNCITLMIHLKIVNVLSL